MYHENLTPVHKRPLVSFIFRRSVVIVDLFPEARAIMRRSALWRARAYHQSIVA